MQIIIKQKYQKYILLTLKSNVINTIHINYIYQTLQYLYSCFKYTQTISVNVKRLFSDFKNMLTNKLLASLKKNQKFIWLFILIINKCINLFKKKMSLVLYLINYYKLLNLNKPNKNYVYNSF